MARTDGFPDARTCADQLACNRSTCINPAVCWTKGGCVKRYTPDPRGGARISDSAALKRKIVKEGWCRVEECGGRADDPHHIVFRSDGGDDVEANIVGICRMHHDILHFSAGDDYQETRDAIGAALHNDEIRYVIHKKGPEAGADFLHRTYGVPLGRIAEAIVTPTEKA